MLLPIRNQYCENNIDKSVCIILDQFLYICDTDTLVMFPTVVPRKRRRTDSDSSGKEPQKEVNKETDQPKPSIVKEESDNEASPPKSQKLDPEQTEETPLIEESKQKEKEKPETEEQDSNRKESEESESPKKELKTSVEDLAPKSPQPTESSAEVTPKLGTSTPGSSKSDEPCSSSKASPGSSSATTKMPVREKPNSVDLVVKHIEYVFSMIKK